MEKLEYLMKHYEDLLEKEDIQMMRNIWKCKIQTITECIELLRGA